MGSQQKIAIGAVLCVFGAMSIFLSAILGWSALDRPWGFLLGFLSGVSAGSGAVLVIAGLLQRRRS